MTSICTARLVYIDTSNALFVTETEPCQAVFRSPPKACTHRPAQCARIRSQTTPISSRSPPTLRAILAFNVLTFSVHAKFHPDLSSALKRQSHWLLEERRPDKNNNKNNRNN